VHVKNELTKSFYERDLGDAEVFHGLQIVHDRVQGTLWVVMGQS
jgi:hypothetical protein